MTISSNMILSYHAPPGANCGPPHRARARSPTSAAKHSYDAATSTYSGRLQGAVSQGDVNRYFIPAFQHQLQTMATRNPCDNTCMQVRTIFDTGGTADPACGAPSVCRNPDGTCALKNDGMIAYCEVSTSGLVRNLFSPDIQLTDGKGNYAPTPDGSAKDSLSVALGFTAVPASF
jgi:hypothetical protein